MYIEQLKNRNIYIPTFFILPLAFVALMVWNYIETLDVDVNEVIKNTIKLLGVNGAFVAMIIPLSAGLFVLFFWVKFIQNISIKTFTTSRTKIDWKRIFLSFLIWGVLTCLTIFLSYLFSPEQFVFNFKPNKFFVFLILAILLIPLQTSFEEYLFRGQLLQGLGLATNSRLIPLIVTSIMFGLMHAANPEVEKVGWFIMVYYIGTGFFLGIITLMDEGLELALGFHAANNLVSALLVTSDWTAFQTHSILKDVSEPSTNIEILVPIFIFYPILLFVFSKIYKWKNWKQKLTGNLIFNDTTL